jgi:hypothetical protein
VLGSGGRGFGGESAERDGSIAPRKYGSEGVKKRLVVGNVTGGDWWMSLATGGSARRQSSC